MKTFFTQRYSALMKSSVCLPRTAPMAVRAFGVCALAFPVLFFRSGHFGSSLINASGLKTGVALFIRAAEGFVITKDCVVLLHTIRRISVSVLIS